MKTVTGENSKLSHMRLTVPMHQLTLPSMHDSTLRQNIKGAFISLNFITLAHSELLFLAGGLCFLQLNISPSCFDAPLDSLERYYIAFFPSLKCSFSILLGLMTFSDHLKNDAQ